MTREYQFTTGPETSDQPAAGTPSDDADLVNKGYADGRYMQGQRAVADITALKAIAIADRADGNLINVLSLNVLYIFDQGSAAAGDDDFVVAPDAGSGRWLKATNTGGDQTAQFDAVSPTTTKGDLIANDGTNNVRLPAGTDGLYLQADSTQSTGYKFANPSSTGDVLGPATSTDNTIARFNGTNNKTIQGSGVAIDDSNNVTGVTNLTASGTVQSDVLEADTITDEAGTGAPNLSNGMKVSGGTSVLDNYTQGLSNADNDFSAGQLRYTRVGDTVTISTKTTITSSTAGAAKSTSASFLPAAFRPPITQENVYSYDATHVFKMRVFSTGQITLEVKTWSGAGGSVSAWVAPSISYTVEP